MNIIHKLRYFNSKRYNLSYVDSHTRLADYEEAIKFFKTNTDYFIGFCAVLSYDIEEYHELYCQRPIISFNHPYWFSLNKRGYKKRVKLLERAIKLLKQNT